MDDKKNTETDFIIPWCCHCGWPLRSCAVGNGLAIAFGGILVQLVSFFLQSKKGKASNLFIMNKRQKLQLVLAGIALALIIFWLISPGWGAGKILGIIANALLILAMLLSYRAEEKMKKKDGDKTA